MVLPYHHETRLLYSEYGIIKLGIPGKPHDNPYPITLGNEDPDFVSTGTLYGCPRYVVSVKVTDDMTGIPWEVMYDYLAQDFRRGEHPIEEGALGDVQRKNNDHLTENQSEIQQFIKKQLAENTLLLKRNNELEVRIIEDKQEIQVHAQQQLKEYKKQTEKTFQEAIKSLKTTDTKTETQLMENTSEDVGTCLLGKIFLNEKELLLEQKPIITVPITKQLKRMPTV
ncbi:hypothetical protein BZA77DRAFT_289446 [Pyronema omphalodes]|nr:hypothetical protein BZA77DRAFT_289446 [Pyronema omphalodes]